MGYEELLREIGFTKYEAIAYSTLINEGVIEAQELSHKSKIPVGRIYETLTTLNNYGFVEIQKSRPRKYMPVKPKIALNTLRLKKEEETKNEIDLFNRKVSEVERVLEDTSFPEQTETRFWSADVGEANIKRAIKTFFGEAEHELLVAHAKPVGKVPRKEQIISFSLAELVPMIKKGIKIKLIVAESPLVDELKKKFSLIEDEDEKKEIIRLVEIVLLNEPYVFSIVDERIVSLPISNPLEPKTNKMIGNIKIYDEDYAMKLKKKFNELWVMGEKVTLE